MVMTPANPTPRAMSGFFTVMAVARIARNIKKKKNSFSSFRLLIVYTAYLIGYLVFKGFCGTVSY